MTIFGILFFYIWRKTNTRWGEERQVIEGRKIQYIQQGFGGIKEIKLLGQENYVTDIFKKIISRVSIISRNQQLIQFIPKLSLETFAVIAMGSIIIFLVSYNYDRSNLIYYLGIYVLAGYRLMPLIARIISNSQIIQFYLPVVKVINLELGHSRINNSHKKTDLNQEPLNFRGLIELNDVSLTYKNSDKASLKNINLKIKCGSTIGIMGESGSGKSSLVDLILGLLEPTKGNIFVDGKNINTDIKKWQALIGYVPQDIYLNDDTIKNNIAFGLNPTDIDDHKLKEALRSAQLDEFIKSLKNGEDTVVGERGVRLSGGQLQRIGIARAIYHNPPIIVLDEATSSLDEKTESEVMKSIYKMSVKKTILIISHRKSTLNKCEKIFILKKGEVQ